MLIEYRVKIKVQLLGAFLHQPINVKDKSTIAKEEKQKKQNTIGLALNGTMCDYKIICEDKIYSCHKAVLASNSNVFKVMFTSEGFEDSRSETTQIKDFS